MKKGRKSGNVKIRNALLEKPGNVSTIITLVNS